jgi:hypothetical protein
MAKWTEQEREQFNNFINEVLYEKLTIQDYHNIMRKLGANYNGSRFNTICHNIDGGKYNLAFNEEDKYFTCFSECGCSYSLLSLVKKRRELIGEPCSTYRSMKWICEQCGIDFNFKEEVKEVKNNIYNWQNLLRYTKEHKCSENKIYSNSILSELEDCCYIPWIKEGITEEIQEKYQIKWYNRTQQVVIPVRNINGDLVGCHCRNTNPDLIADGMKYIPLRMLNGDEYKFQMGLELFGLNYNKVNIEKSKSVILVESPKSVMQADNFDMPNICGGMFGMNFSLQKLKLLLNLGVDKFVIALDKQYEEIGNAEYKAWEKKVNKIIDIVRPYANEISVIWDKDKLLNYKDSPTDKGQDVFMKLWNEREVL